MKHTEANQYNRGYDRKTKRGSCGGGFVRKTWRNSQRPRPHGKDELQGPATGSEERHRHPLAQTR
jgi:hypothetical protein